MTHYIMLLLLVLASMAAGAAPFVHIRLWHGVPRIFQRAMRVKNMDVVVAETEGGYITGRLVDYNPDNGLALLECQDGTSVWLPIQTTREVLYL